MKQEKKLAAVLSDGQEIQIFTLDNGKIAFSAINYGATITSLFAPNRAGLREDVLLGLSSPAEYPAKNFPHFGSTVGPVANRIAAAKFSLGGKEFSLDKNDGENCLHGGFRGLGRRVWKGEFLQEKEGAAVKFSYFKHEGEMGFPAETEFEVLYVLDEKEPKLTLKFFARPKSAAPINLANHAYFNLSGDFHKKIDEHILRLSCEKYLPVDSALIPTGELKDVEGTPFDFRKAKKIGADIEKTCGGYDHCFVTGAECGTPKEIAFVREQTNGRTLRVSTDLPGVQFYSGNMLAGNAGKFCQIHAEREGFCLETEHFPDAINQKNFPPCVFDENRHYEATTIWEFGIDNG